MAKKKSVTKKKVATKSRKTSTAKVSAKKKTTKTKIAVKKKSNLKKVAAKKGSARKKAGRGTTSKRVTIKTPSKGAKPKSGSKGAPSLKASSKSSKSIKEWADFFTPIDNRILILIDESSFKTVGGLYIPETAQSDSTEGSVVAVGRGHRTKKGHVRPIEVKVGDKVIFKKYGGHKIRLQDSELIIIQEDEIVGVRTA